MPCSIWVTRSPGARLDASARKFCARRGVPARAPCGRPECPARRRWRNRALRSRARCPARQCRQRLPCSVWRVGPILDAADGVKAVIGQHPAHAFGRAFASRLATSTRLSARLQGLQVIGGGLEHVDFAACARSGAKSRPACRRHRRWSWIPAPGTARARAPDVAPAPPSIPRRSDKASPASAACKAAP